jgi:Zn-dependent metalloprotease
MERCVCTVVPPHMYKEIAQRGKPDERKWAMHSLAQTATLLGRRNIVGAMVASLQTGGGNLTRTVYDARGSQELPGIQIRAEGGPASSDTDVNQAYDGAGATYNMLWSRFQRNGLDGNGGRLDSTVHYGRGYQNAFFDGSQMVYGDGDGRIFLHFTKCIDVIGHEFCHGVTQHTCNLVYFDQSGALNESFSDCMGSLVKQMALNQNADNADWLIGSGLLGPTIKGVALRSMKAPGTAYNDQTLGRDPQPANMSQYIQTDEDQGGVHTNSGIPNHAFFLAATGMHDSYKAGLVWYKAWTNFMRPRSQFQDCANFTTFVAKQLFGNNSAEANAVNNAWRVVGIVPQA